ncbi:MAG: hypothetical protein ACREQW_17970 [Candidatus Binatia bacterium]
MSEKLVLDSLALLSLYHREPGWQVVQKALYDQDKARTRVVLNWINWGEFLYIVKRRVGPAKTPWTRSTSSNNFPSNFTRWTSRSSAPRQK